MVHIPNQTSDGLEYHAINRIPGGYTQYPTGLADNIANGTYGDGEILMLTEASPTKYFQLLNHWYAVGAKAIWESCSLNDYLDAWLQCPATLGLTTETGDYTIEQSVKIKPVAAGTGDKSLDLTAKLTGTNILKCVPVPSPGNTGWFDYAKWDNELTRNMSQAGGYDLYIMEITLFRFANHLWASSIDGSTSSCECDDVVGKLIYNSWRIKFTLSGSTTGRKAGINMVTFVKQNL